MARRQPQLTPYDTGARLAPEAWVSPDGRVGESRRPAQPDDYGKVDFTDDENATIAVAYIARTPEGQYVLYLEECGYDVNVHRL